MFVADAVEAKAKECVLCGELVTGGARGMDRHAASSCSWRPSPPSLSLGMDGR
jgi:hypothetical protein